MTTAVKEKKPFLPQRKPAAPAAGGAVALRGAPVGRAGSGLAPLAIGGEPRVHLLPVEVVERKKVKILKRRLLIAGVVVVALVAAGYGLATVSLSSAQSQLAAAQATQAQLVTQQSRYSAVTNVNNDISSIQQSQKSTTSQEILWAPYLLTLEDGLPAGAQITAFSALMDNPLGIPVGTTPTAPGPLEGVHIATLQLSVDMNQGDIPAWLNSLPKLKGFVDATPNSVTSANNAAGQYSVVVTIHINDKAVSNRFTKATGDTK